MKKNAENKFLLVARHAHRDTSHRSLDNGLDEKGWKQARRLSEFLLKEKWEVDQIYSSPKQRCVETLEPFAEAVQKQIQIEKRLDEEGDAGFKAMLKQMESFFEDWKKAEAAVTLISSHGDWIPEFMKRFAEFDLDLDKGGLAILRFDSKKMSFIVKEVFQKF